MSAHDPDAIRIEGACVHNLRDLTLEIPRNRMTVVTGVSGAGKSSLVFDTLYAEGQRRYVETFSPYARQFLERMDKPDVRRIENVPPAIAIGQANGIKTSRSTVGTLTGLADHLKLLYARAATLYCPQCAQAVRPDTPERIAQFLRAQTDWQQARCMVTFAFRVPHTLPENEVTALLAQQGYTRIHAQTQCDDGQREIEVVQDRFRLATVGEARLQEALQAAFARGHGRLRVRAVLDEGREIQWPFSAGLHCARCDTRFAAATPGLFSFNSPVGACETCRGFGRVIGVDFALVAPDESKTLAQGVIKLWQGKSFRECQDDLMKMAKKYGVPTDVPLRELSPEHRTWLFEGDATWVSWQKSWPRKWYGVRHFFDWLESKAYKMHIRVLLSRYRSYTACPACHGARLKPAAHAWRLGERRASIAEMMAMPVSEARDTVRAFAAANHDAALARLLAETVQRLDYLCDVGLGYLTLERQARTLSGGELQRINLTTALGTALVNTLFVFDEPSAGLHPQDAGRILGIMQRLRDAGNTLVVVEHNAHFLRAADWVVELGPGAGAGGGQIVAQTTPAQLAARADTLTGEYLAGKRQVAPPVGAAAVPEAFAASVRLAGVQFRNLRGLSLEIPLDRLTVLVGVSGSGKSTLVEDVLHPALLRHFRQGDARAPSADEDGAPLAGVTLAFTGAATLRRVVLVDQSPIGKSARACPASHVGAWERIRRRFTALPLARERGYTLGTFSFNSGNGRCPSCGGSGFEHIEMQFLSDVWLRCPDCDGRRYRPEILEVQLNGKNIADVLALTVREAVEFFRDDAAIVAALEPLLAVGLDYLQLGQPTPTLSGGEAQRLKIAAAGLTANQNEPTLFLFDEPSAGLHLHDIAGLLAVFRRLQAAGHALLVIEHNLEIMRAADWVIELGPGAGAAGGRLVAQGTPAALAAHADSPTGAALRAARSARKKAVRKVAEAPAPAYGVRPVIAVRNAREHNLRHLDVDIPRDVLTVITGLSGSGKSTLAFDIVFGEGQRRYLESLNAYARQFVQPGARPELDSLTGLAPTVAIEQRTSRGGRKSTVATLTEIHPFLRLLYTKLGTQYCPQCNVPVRAQSFDAIAAAVQADYAGRAVTLLAPLVTARKGLYATLARQMAAQGFARLRVDGQMLPTQPWPRLDRYHEHTIELPVATLTPAPETAAELRAALARALEYGKGVVRVLQDDTQDAQETFSLHRACPECGQGFPEPDPRHFSWNNRGGWCPDCYGTGERLHGRVPDPHALDLPAREDDDATAPATPCPRCHGERLNAAARAVRFHGQTLPQLTALSIDEAARWCEALVLDGREAALARDALAQVRSRLRFLQQSGLGYLSLARAAPTLSGGEAQRIRLAAQLGSSLRGVCYVLDEPTIGLHPRDTARLLDTLTALRDAGNTLIVVEHDEDTIARADHIIDLGPGAGQHGGQVVAQGSYAEIVAHPQSVTGRALREHQHAAPEDALPVPPEHPHLRLHGARLHNLRGLDVALPLGRLVVLTGVSGSGKSTLARDILLPNLTAALASNGRRGGAFSPQHCEALEGWQGVRRVLEVDQTPIGKTPRSCPATYVGFWDAIRKLLASTTEARVRGFDAARFSFNTGHGRCPVCLGQGQITTEMSFLPDVKIPCEACGGTRFTEDTRSVRWRGHSVADLLALPVAQARELFADHRAIARPLQLLDDMGLGYLTLGQPSPTLSGGEAQRIKLIAELAKRPPARRGAAQSEGGTLYILDEPTVGLHKADVARLRAVLRQLVAAGNSLLVIEHDLDIIAAADWIVDLGPEGGEAGGQIVAQGSPAELLRHPTSHTAQALRGWLPRKD